MSELKACFIDTKGHCHVHGAPALSRCEEWARQMSRSDDAGRLKAAEALADAADRIISKHPDEWGDSPLASALQAYYDSLPASPSAEPCQPGCVDGKMLEYNPRSGQGKEYPCPKCAPAKEYARCERCAEEHPVASGAQRECPKCLTPRKFFMVNAPAKEDEKCAACTHLRSEHPCGDECNHEWPGDSATFCACKRFVPAHPGEGGL